MPKDELVNKIAKEIYYKHLLVIECLNDKDYISYKARLKDVHNIDETWWSKRANYRIKELKKLYRK